MLNFRIIQAHEYTPSDIVEIGRSVQQEAGNQSDLGKRLVVDTILNRVDSDRFPNTPIEVINQPGQYTKIRGNPPEELYSLIAEEIYVRRTNSEVLWFKKYNYHKYGNPIIKEGDHYFSGGM